MLMCFIDVMIRLVIETHVPQKSHGIPDSLAMPETSSEFVIALGIAISILNV